MPCYWPCQSKEKGKRKKAKGKKRKAEIKRRAEMEQTV
jgi:hypothetical protein